MLHQATLSTEASGPLKGLKVLDLSRLIAGNFLTFHLADMGANVIKVEDPVNGDPLRHFTEEGISTYWKVFCRNKKSICVNLRSPQGRKIILDLVRSADALVENFRPGTLEKLELGPDVLLSANPKLVIVRISGWGDSGPYCHKPGFGTLIEAFSGLAAKSGFGDREPLLPNLGLADMFTGLLGAYALMAALREVEVSRGKGQVIDLNLLESMVSVLGADPAIAKITGKPIARSGNRSKTAAPRNIYRTKDGGYVALSASMQSMAERLFTAIGRADLIEDPRYRTNADRVRNCHTLDAIIAGFIEQKPLDENLAFFDRHNITAGAVHDARSIIEDPHVIEREVYVDVDDAQFGPLPMPNVAPRLSNTPGGIHSSAPSMGEHTISVLSGLGFDSKSIEALVAAGVVK